MEDSIKDPTLAEEDTHWVRASRLEATKAAPPLAIDKNQPSILNQIIKVLLIACAV